MTLRIGFIGCGLIGRSHARKLSEVDDADIVSVFDIDSDRCVAFAQDFAAEASSDAEAVIGASDAVYVTTWTAAHPGLVSMVAHAGKPVFCEKPLAIDLMLAEAMVADVEEAGVVNQVGLILRSSPSFRWLRHHVLSSSTGHPMSMVFRDDQYIPTQGMYGSTWRGDHQLAGSGTLLEHSIHDLDLIEWILGRIVAVTCLTGNTHGLEGIEDHATVTLLAASGAIATLSSTWHDVLSRPSQRLVEVFCTDAYLALDGDWHGPMRMQTSDDSVTIGEGEPSIEAALAVDGGGTNPDADFVAAVLDGRPAHPDFRTALRAHVLADAAYRSAASGGAPIEV